MPTATPIPRGPSGLPLYSAADLLTAPGCPVCRYTSEVSDRYLGWFAMQAHTEAGTITRLCASLGMCARHTRGLMGQPGAATRLTAVYRYVLVSARDRLAGQATPVAACLACEHDTAAADRALDTLLEGLTDPIVMDRCRDLGGLCIPHLRVATARGHRRVATWLTETMTLTLSARRPGVEWLAGGPDRDAEVRVALRQAIPGQTDPGWYACAACLAAGRAERDLLAQLPFHATGNYTQAPALLLCADHLADAALDAARGGMLALLAWQADCLVARVTRPSASLAGQSSGDLSAWLRRVRRRPDLLGYCAVCRASEHAATRALDGFRDGLRGAGQGPDGVVMLCVRHLLSLRTAAAQAGQVSARAAVGHGDRLIAELAEAFRKTTWMHRAETRGPEMTAWRRAAAFVDGSVFYGSVPHEY